MRKKPYTQGEHGGSDLCIRRVCSHRLGKGICGGGWSEHSIINLYLVYHVSVWRWAASSAAQCGSLSSGKNVWLRRLSGGPRENSCMAALLSLIKEIRSGTGRILEDGRY